MTAVHPFSMYSSVIRDEPHLVSSAFKAFQRRPSLSSSAAAPPPPSSSLSSLRPQYDTGLSSPLLRLRETSVFCVRIGVSAVALLSQGCDLLLVEDVSCHSSHCVGNTASPSIRTGTGVGRRDYNLAGQVAEIPDISWSQLEALLRQASFELASDMPSSSEWLDLRDPSQTDALVTELRRRLGELVWVEHIELRLTPYLEVALGLSGPSPSPLCTTGNGTCRHRCKCCRRHVDRGFIDSILAACAALSGPGSLRLLRTEASIPTNNITNTSTRRRDEREGSTSASIETEERVSMSSLSSGSTCTPRRPEELEQEEGEGKYKASSRDARLPPFRSSPSAFLSADEARALYQSPTHREGQGPGEGEEEEEELVAAAVVHPPPRKVLRYSPRSVVALGDLSFDEAFQ